MNINNPKISVIIPSFNRFHYLLNAVNSVLNQTYKNLEIIVINDGSDQKEYYDYNLDEKVNIIHLKDTKKKFMVLVLGQLEILEHQKHPVII